MKKKSKRRFGKKVSTEDWLKLKPYGTFKLYDRFYLNQAELVYSILQQYKSRFQSCKFLGKDYSELACVLTSYFEDFINEIGIWDHFREVNQKLYGYPLPFYDLSDYDAECLNPEDFSYIIWHYTSKKSKLYLAPDEPIFLDLGFALFDLLEPRLEDAPLTGFYEAFFAIPDDTVFFELKSRLKWFAFHAYPLVNEINADYKEALDGFMKNKENHIQSNVDGYAYGIEEDYIYSKRSGYSAISTLEWFAGVATCSPDTHLDILHLNERIMSQFFYEKTEGKYWIFKEVYTDRLFSIRKESVSIPKDAQKKGYMQAMSILSWKGEWWMSGMMMSYGEMPAYLIEKTKKEIQNTPFYSYTKDQQAALRKDTDFMYQLFVEYFGTPIVLFEDNAQLQKAMQEFGVFYNDRRVIDKEAGRKAKEKYDKEYKELADNSKIENLKFDALSGLGLIFLPKQGQVINSNLGKTISLMKAPSINKNDAVLLLQALTGQGSEYFLTQYLLENYPTHNIKFPIPASQMNVVREVHFLNRFLNADNFGKPIPNLRHIDLSSKK